MTDDWIYDSQHDLIWHKPTGKCWTLDLLLEKPATPIRQDGFTVVETIDLLTLLEWIKDPQLA